MRNPYFLSKQGNSETHTHNQDAYQPCYWESFTLTIETQSLIAQPLADHMQRARDSEASESKASTDSCEGLEQITVLVSKSAAAQEQ